MDWTIRLRALSHHVTWWLGKNFPSAIPLIYVVGYPRSGTTWACQVLADAMQLPFPRYSLLPIGCPAVVHGHELARPDYPKGVYVMRDGRDALLSRFHFLQRDFPKSGPIPRALRSYFPARDKPEAEQLAIYIEREMQQPMFDHTWADHVLSYVRLTSSNMALLRYEDLLADGPKTLAAVVSTLRGDEPDVEMARLTLERYDFRRQASRKLSGPEKKGHLRSGTQGGWRAQYSRQAAEVFDRYCGEALIEAGYESDHRWVETVANVREQDGARVGATA